MLLLRATKTLNRAARRLSSAAAAPRVVVELISDTM